jgi:hypothetical protein
MHKILVHLYIIYLLKSSTCFEHYPAHLQEVYVIISSAGGLRRNWINTASGIVTLCRWLFCARLKKKRIFLPFATGVLHLIQINHQPDATFFQFIILMFVYSSTCFGGFPAHHQELNDCSGSLWFYLRIVVIRRPARPRTHHNYHHDTKVKPETVAVVTELLTMGGKTPETCWAVSRRQDNKIVALGWWFIWIERWCTDLQTLNFTFKF